MKRLLALSAIPACLVLLHAGLSTGDTLRPGEPGTVEEQRTTVPPEETPLDAVWEDLGSDKAARKEGALLWLLRRNRAGELGHFAFPSQSIRFGVDRVRKVEAGGIAWRLVECEYLSRQASRSASTEFRASWQVAYLFDDLGHLRDWVEDYDVLFLDDLNLDGCVDLFAYLDSPKRAILYSCERGRSREILRVDGVPEGADAIRILPAQAGSPCEVAVAGRGTYAWDKRLQRYAEAAPRDGGKK